MPSPVDSIALYKTKVRDTVQIKPQKSSAEVPLNKHTVAFLDSVGQHSSKAEWFIRSYPTGELEGAIQSASRLYKHCTTVEKGILMAHVPHKPAVVAFADDCIESHKEEIVSNLWSFWVAIKHPDIEILTNLIINNLR